MKKIIILSAFMGASFLGFSQVSVPAASPKSSKEQIVGLTTIDIEYSRPSTKGRNIFGDLVPFGRTWRTGANANTTISFSNDVIIDGKVLPKGKYALYTIPKVEKWEIIFYKDVNNWGLPNEWKEDRVALRANANSQILNINVETFTVDLNSITNDSANLEIIWDKTLVALKIEVPTDAQVMASINKVMAGPTSEDYFASAQYFYQSNKETNKALVWVDKALELSAEKPFYYLRLKSLIQNKIGDKTGAIETAKLSLAASEKAGNADYVKMNKESIAEWSRK